MRVILGREFSPHGSGRRRNHGRIIEPAGQRRHQGLPRIERYLFQILQVPPPSHPQGAETGRPSIDQHRQPRERSLRWRRALQGRGKRRLRRRRLGRPRLGGGSGPAPGSGRTTTSVLVAGMKAPDVLGCDCRKQQTARPVATLASVEAIPQASRRGRKERAGRRRGGGNPASRRVFTSRGADSRRSEGRRCNRTRAASNSAAQRGHSVKCDWMNWRARGSRSPLR